MTAAARKNEFDLERLAARHSADLLTVHADDGTCLYASAEAVRIFARNPDLLLHRRLQDFAVIDDRASLEEQLVHLRRSELRRLRYRVETLDGTTRLVETLVRKSPPFLFAATRELGSERVREEAESAQFRMEARTDALTQLPNRWGLEEALERELERYLRSGRVFSCALFDVDRFSPINDACGPSFGDHVLRLIGAIIGRGRRSYDVLGRWGGDEFLLILPDTSATEAQTVAARIVAQVAVEFAREWPRLHVTVSAGVIVSTGSAAIDDLVGRTDRALFEAKASGGNCVRVAMPAAMMAIESASDVLA